MSLKLKVNYTYDCSVGYGCRSETFDIPFYIVHIERYVKNLISINNPDYSNVVIDGVEEIRK